MQDEAKQFAFLATVTFQGFTKQLKLPVLGQGVLAGLRVTPDIVRFGEVPHNKAADVLVPAPRTPIPSIRLNAAETCTQRP